VTRPYRIRYEPLAQAALEEAAAYIQRESGPGRAEGWLRAMLEAADKLESLPKAFGIWTTREGQPVYSKLVSPYRVFYVVHDATATVHVIDIVHTARETRLAEYREPPG
jgi:plasmid stabilization system protein ParE